MYSRYYPTWRDWPNITTPVTAAVMQHIEDGLVAAGPAINVAATYGTDTASVNAAIAALNSAGQGMLFLQGPFNVTGALTTITVPAIIQGGAPNNNGTVITTSSTSADVFTVASDNVVFRDLKIKGAGSTPSAGAGIKWSSGKSGKVDNCEISSTFYGVYLDDGAYQFWLGGGCYIVNFYQYGLYRPYNGVDADRGDDIILGNTFDSSVALSGAACVRWEAHGGPKFTANKFLHGDYAFDLQVADGATTSVCLFVGNSCEDQAVANMRIGQTSVTGSFSYITVAGNELSAPGLTNILVGNGIANLPITGNVLINNSSGVGVDVTGDAVDVGVTGNSFANHNIAVRFGVNANQPTLGPNQYQGVITTLSDQTIQTTTQASDQSNRHRRHISVSSSSAYTNLFELDMGATRHCRIELVCDFIVQGVGESGGYLQRFISRGASGNCTVTTIGSDVTTGTAFDIQFDVTTTAGTVYIGFRRNSGGGGTSLDGLVSLIVDGHTAHTIRS